MAVVCSDMEIVKEPPACSCHLTDRGVEHLLVGVRGSMETADLPNELERGVVQLLVGGGVPRGSEPFDVPAHVRTSQ
jgi:hypothetical protein